MPLWNSRLNTSLRAVTLILLGLSAVSARSSAAVITLTDGNSVAQVDPGSSSGMYYWAVEGQNQLAQQWFWYRVGNASPEQPINSLSAPAVVLTGTRQATTTYAGSGLNVGITYLLSGGALGSGQASIQESISLQNTSGQTMSLHFFQYSDFDLGSTGGGDTVHIGTNNAGLFNEALQTEGLLKLSETVTTPGANHAEASLFNLTLVKLGNGSADNLNDAVSAGPGDATWALQWDITLPAGGSFLISKLKEIDIGVVPEPSSMALLGCGFGLLLVRRRAQGLNKGLASVEPPAK